MSCVDLNHKSGYRYGSVPDIRSPASKLKYPSGIGVRLRAELDRIGISDAEACRRLGMHRTTIGEICTEHVALSATVAARLARIGIDGRALFLEQAENKLRWFEDREARL